MQQLAKKIDLQLVALLAGYDTEELRTGEGDIDIAFLKRKTLENEYQKIAEKLVYQSIKDTLKYYLEYGVFKDNYGIYFRKLKVWGS